MSDFTIMGRVTDFRRMKVHLKLYSVKDFAKGLFRGLNSPSP